MDSSTVGQWQEIWFVGGSQASPTLEFTVSAPPPEGCQFNPSLQGNYIPTMYSWDYWSLTDLLQVYSYGPGTDSHSVTSGPCVFTWAYSYDSESAQSSAEVTPNLKTVNWTVKDKVFETYQGIPLYRDNYYDCNTCYGNWTLGYAYYESGSVTSVFINSDTQEQFQITSYYQFVIQGAQID